VLAGAAAAVPARTDRLANLVAALGIAGVVLLLAALAARLPALVPWGLALVGAEYGAFLLIRGHVIDAYAPFYAVALLVAGELSFWALEPERGRRERGLLGRRITLIAASSLVAGGLGALVLSASEVVVHGGVWLELLGVAAAVVALVLLARMARTE
jgi:hypothetical protein